MKNFNCYNYLDNPYDGVSKSSGGVTWIRNSDGSIHVSCTTASSTSLYNITYPITYMADWIVPGKTYKVNYKCTSRKVQFRVLVGTVSEPTGTNILSTYEDATFTLPEDTTGVIFRLAVSSGTTNVDEIVHPIILNTSSNDELSDKLDTTYNYTINNYNSIISTNIVNLLWINGNTNIHPGWSYYSHGCSISMIEDGSFHWVGSEIDPDPYINLTPTTMPEWVTPGETYYVNYVSTSGRVELRIYEDSGDGNYTRTYTIKNAQNYPITINSNTVGMLFRLYCSVPSGTTISLDEYVNPIITSHPFSADSLQHIISSNFDDLLSNYDAWKYGGVDYSDGELYLNSYGARRGILLQMSKSIKLFMKSSKYVFRVYWIKDNSYHATTWGRCWTIPKGVPAGIGICIASDHSQYFDEDEYPEKYLRIYDSSIQDYFIEEIENVADRVDSINTEPGLVFLLSTDQHFYSVQGTLVEYDTVSSMTNNMKELSKKIKIDGHISLGDIADFKVGSVSNFNKFGVLQNDNYPLLDQVFAEWRKEAMNCLASVHPNFIYVPGNHDDNRYINKDVIHDSTSTYDYSPYEMYSYYSSRSLYPRVSNLSNYGLDYYIDYPEHNIRMFCLHASHWYDASSTSPHGYHECWWYGYNDSTVTWFTSQLNQVPQGYSVLLLSHMSPVKSNNADDVSYINMSNIQSAIQTFINNGGDYIATLYGHSHVDWSTTDPWLEITFAAQKSENSTPSYSNMPGAVNPIRTQSTSTEDCWNVIVIQPISRKINVIRFGAGDDRTFSY